MKLSLWDRKQLKNEEDKLKNRFLRNGIAMIVDGYNAKNIYELMDREMNTMLDRPQLRTKGFSIHVRTGSHIWNGRNTDWSGVNVNAY